MKILIVALTCILASALSADEVAKGKNLFTAKACFTCHQIDPKVPSPTGDALKVEHTKDTFYALGQEYADL